ncbi:MAG: hypothetical protein ACKV2V_08630 [Blastocatellia bacterium]
MTGNQGIGNPPLSGAGGWESTEPEHSQPAPVRDPVTGVAPPGAPPGGVQGQLPTSGEGVNLPVDPAQIWQAQSPGALTSLFTAQPSGTRRLTDGVWLGQDHLRKPALLSVTSSGATLVLARGRGQIWSAIQLNREGRFRAHGTFQRDSGAAHESAQAATFTGTLREGVLRLQVTDKRGRLLGSASLRLDAGGETTPVAPGVWGIADNVTTPHLNVTQEGAGFIGQNRSGTISEPLRTDASGDFTARGTYKFGPPASLAPEIEAVYSGNIRETANGRVMRLDIRRADGALLESVQIRRLSTISHPVQNGQYTNGDPRADGALLDVSSAGATFTAGRAMRGDINTPLQVDMNGSFRAEGTFFSGATGFQSVPAIYTGTWDRGGIGNPARLHLRIADQDGKVLLETTLTLDPGRPVSQPIPAGRYINGKPAADGSFMDVTASGAQYSAGLGGGGEITGPLRPDNAGNFQAQGIYRGIASGFRTVPAIFSGVYHPGANGEPPRISLTITDLNDRTLGADQLTLAPGPAPQLRVPQGPWSGVGSGEGSGVGSGVGPGGGISMSVSQNGAYLEIGRAVIGGAPEIPAFIGQINTPLQLDTAGRFELRGTLDPGIKSAIFPPPPLDVIYSGQLSGDLLTLRIIDLNGTEYGSYVLRQGRRVESPAAFIPPTDPGQPYPALTSLHVSRDQNDAIRLTGALNVPDPAWRLSARTSVGGDTLQIELETTRDAGIIAPQVISPRDFALTINDPQRRLSRLALRLPALFGQPARTLTYALPQQSGKGFALTSGVVTGGPGRAS